jgi:hypothetical protein
MKSAYNYLFYKLYKFWNHVSGDSWSDFKALLILGGIEAVLFLECAIWWAVITRSILNFNKYWLIAVALLITIINYFTFLHQGNYKKMIREFDKLPIRINKLGSWIVFGLLLLVIVSLFFAFYSMSKIDWRQYSYTHLV